MNSAVFVIVTALPILGAALWAVLARRERRVERERQVYMQWWRDHTPPQE